MTLKTELGAPFRRIYGSSPAHLLTVSLALVTTAFIAYQAGPSTLWSGPSWWQTVIVWFVGSVILHDLILFPAYSAIDKVIGAAGRRRERVRRRVPMRNYIRIPGIATALIFVVFFPGILRQGSETYNAATGFDQSPYLLRFVVISVAMFGASVAAYGVAYTVAIARTRRRGAAAVSLSHPNRPTPPHLPKSARHRDHDRPS